MDERRYARRPLLGAMLGGGAAIAVPDNAAARPSSQPGRAGLVSILDFIPTELHAAILANSDTTDLTDQIQAAFDSGARLWAPAEARFHVRRVTIRGVGRFFDLNNALFVGIATAPTNAVVELQCGHSEVRGLRVTANRSLSYRAAVHYYTNDAEARPAGLNRFLGGQADGAAIGLLIGGLPNQRRFRKDRDSAGTAVDAPVSESTFIQWNMTGCIRGVVMNQPNGKLQFIGCHLAGETADWKAPQSPRADAAAITILNPGSEICVIGGSVEQLQEPDGRFLEVVDGTLTISAATIETICSSFMAGSARLTFTQLINGGFNSMTAAFVQARADSTGVLTLSQFALMMPPANSTKGTGDLVACVSEFNGQSAVAPGLLVDLANVELREPRWSGGGDDLYPLVRGARLRMRQCRLTVYSSDNLRRLADIAIDDGDDRLGGTVDRSAATLPPFGARAGAAAGGWVISSGTGGRWGRVDIGGGESALQLAGGRQPVAARSESFPIDRGRLFVLRAACRFANAGKISFSVAWLDYLGEEIERTILFEGVPKKPIQTPDVQWISLQATAPTGAERAMIIIEAGPGAVIAFARPSVN